jgi:enterobactin synthetase component D / holo-[acyl-carrier protein] synthase
VLADVLPPAAVSAESFGAAESLGPEPEPDPGAGLFPAEEALVRTADPRRQAEFTAGRACARTALARLGLPATPVLTGRAGEPRWPAGVTGSVTHCAGYRACAVAFPDPAGTFEARVAGSLLTGRWLARGGLIVTAVARSG